MDGVESPGFYIDLDIDAGTGLGTMRRTDPNAWSALRDPSALHVLPSGELLMTRDRSREVVRVDPDNGIAEHYRTVPSLDVRDMTSRQGDLYLLARNTNFEDVVWRVGPDAAEIFLVLPTPYTTGLAYDPVDDCFYVSHTTAGAPNYFMRVEPDGTVSSVLGASDGIFVNWGDMSFDTSTGTLIGRGSNALLAIDPATATTSYFSSAPTFLGLAFDAMTQRAYGFQQGNGEASSLLGWRTINGGPFNSRYPLDLSGIQSLTCVSEGRWLGVTTTDVVEIGANGRIQIRASDLGLAKPTAVGWEPTLGLAFIEADDGLYGSSDPFVDVSFQGPLVETIRSLIHDQATGGMLGSSGAFVYAIDPLTPSATLIGQASSTNVADMSRSPVPGTFDLLGENRRIDRHDSATASLLQQGVATFEGDFESVRGLAYCPTNSTHYAVEQESNALIGVTAQGRLVAPYGLPLGSLDLLAADPRDGRTFIIAGGDLYFETPTGEFDRILSADFEVMGGAYHTRYDAIYAAAGDRFKIISPTSGSTTDVWTAAGRIVRCMAYDVGSDSLYTTDSLNGVLLTLDADTGFAQEVGSLGGVAVRCLAFDQDTGKLYGIEEDTGRPLLIDRQTGVATVIGPPGFEASDLTWFPN